MYLLLQKKLQTIMKCQVSELKKIKNKLVISVFLLYIRNPLLYCRNIQSE